MSGVKENVIEYAQLQLETKFPRDDYRELLELTIIFLGGKPPRGLKFSKPGPVHHARWMARAIYALKIFIFHKQLEISTSELKGIKDVCVFIVRLHIYAWFSCTSAVSAPRSDLLLLQQLVEYKTIHEAISKVATEKLLRHTWYLNEELIALSFFDASVSHDEKRNMVKALKTREGRWEIQKRPTIPHETIPATKLADFVTTNTKRFFTNLALPTFFLHREPAKWDDIHSYVETQKKLSKLRVVNDAAERGVALIEQYNNVLCRDEEQKQYLLQVVSKHRQQMPNASKNTLLSTF